MRRDRPRFRFVRRSPFGLFYTWKPINEAGHELVAARPSSRNGRLIMAVNEFWGGQHTSQDISTRAAR